MIQGDIESLLFAAVAAAFFAFSTAALADPGSRLERLTQVHQAHLRPACAGSHLQTCFMTVWFRAPVSLSLTTPDRETA